MSHQLRRGQTILKIGSQNISGRISRMGQEDIELGLGLLRHCLKRNGNYNCKGSGKCAPSFMANTVGSFFHVPLISIRKIDRKIYVCHLPQFVAHFDRSWMK